MNKNIRSHRIVRLAFLVVAVTVGCYLLIAAVSADKAREWIRYAPSLEWGDTLEDSIPIAVRSVQPLARIRRNRQRPPSNGSIERARSISPGLHAFVKTRLR
jgi:hypothetical protein